MERVAIITDTNSGMSPEMAREHGVELMSMPVLVDGTEYFEYINITWETFFERLASGAQVSTSQPSPGMMTEMWDRLLESFDTLIYIPMSSGLSGTLATARALSAADYENKVFVVDNRRISVTLYESVLDAVYLRDEGKSAREIAEFIETEGAQSSIYVAVNTLEYLKKGGRVTPAAAAIGTVLGIKPVLTIQGGKLDAYKKVRGMKAAMETMLDAISADVKQRFEGENIRILTAYTGDSDSAQPWQEMVQERFPAMAVERHALPISIACHVGPGSLGIGVTRTIRG